MIITLRDTSAAAVGAALVTARRNTGVSSGMVFTLIAIADGRPVSRVLNACISAGREHPSRILLIAEGKGAEARLDAEIRIGEEVPGEIVILRFNGELIEHEASVVLPLLLPDSPVVAWWPGNAPERLADDPLGALAQRRITDAQSCQDPLGALAIRAQHLHPGDSDLAWARVTPFRGLLAAALDQCPAPVQSARVEAPVRHASAYVLAAWLDARLKVPVTLAESPGPGITAVRLQTDAGELSIVRTDGRTARFNVPGLPSRKVALRRRGIDALITEELRRLDDDVVQDRTMAHLAATGIPKMEGMA